MAKISRIEPKIPALKKRQKVAAYARVSIRLRGRRAESGEKLISTGYAEAKKKWE